MRLAVYQCRSCATAVEHNLDRIERAARKASAGGAALLVCPEMMLTGYRLAPARVVELAEPADGRAAARVAAIARATAMAIVYGYPEKDGTRVYNAAQLVDRAGTVRLNYRKTHLFGGSERAVFTPGDESSGVTNIGGWCVGLLICYDVEFPESARLLALAGADLVLVPTALMTPYQAVPDILVPARAVENQCYLAYANYCDVESDLVYCGASVIAAPDGVRLAQAGLDEVLLIADLDRDRLLASRALNTYLADRRPALYRGLAADDPRS